MEIDPPCVCDNLATTVCTSLCVKIISHMSTHDLSQCPEMILNKIKKSNEIILKMLHSAINVKKVEVNQTLKYE